MGKRAKIIAVLLLLFIFIASFYIQYSMIYPNPRECFLAFNLKDDTFKIQSFLQFHWTVYGSTFFINNKTEYFAFISTWGVDNSTLNIEFNYVPLNNHSNLQKMTVTLPVTISPWIGLSGLTVDYFHGIPQFTTVINSEEYWFLLQFALNGSILRNQDISGSADFPYIWISDVSSYGNGNYCLIHGHQILIVNFEKILDKITLKEYVKTITVLNTSAPAFEFLTFGEGGLDRRINTGAIIKSYPIPLNFYIKEIDAINYTHVFAHALLSPSPTEIIIMHTIFNPFFSLVIWALLVVLYVKKRKGINSDKIAMESELRSPSLPREKEEK